MKSDVLVLTDYIAFPLITVVLFVLMFVGVLWKNFRPGARQISEERARLVFDEENELQGETPERES